jgi:hypothetical protein
MKFIMPIISFFLYSVIIPFLFLFTKNIPMLSFYINYSFLVIIGILISTFYFLYLNFKSIKLYFFILYSIFLFIYYFYIYLNSYFTIDFSGYKIYVDYSSIILFLMLIIIINIVRKGAEIVWKIR